MVGESRKIKSALHAPRLKGYNNANSSGKENLGLKDLPGSEKRRGFTRRTDGLAQRKTKGAETSCEKVAVWEKGWGRK